MPARLRNFVFTLNNYTPEELESISKIPYDYIVYGYEVAPDTGTPHLQGYCELTKQTTLSTIKKYIPRAHIEPRNGTAQQAANYCKKTLNYFEDGVITNQGSRADIHLIKKCIQEGHGIGDMIDILPMNYQNIRLAEKYLCYKEAKRNWAPEVIVITGPSGCGKSKLARELTSEAYVKSEGSKWWDGIDCHSDIIIDDFRPSWMPLTDILRLLDRYECRVETKGGSRQFLGKKIVLTSVKHPETWYEGLDEDSRTQIMRRITKVIELSEKDSEVGGNTSPDFLGD